MATPEMLARAKEFERKTNAQERAYVASRTKRIKKGGFKDENDYFTNVNPFTGKRHHEASPRIKEHNASKSKALHKAKEGIKKGSFKDLGKWTDERGETHHTTVHQRT